MVFAHTISKSYIFVPMACPKAKSSALLFLASLAVVVLIVGCGGGSNSSSSSGSSTESASSEASAAFLQPKSPNNKYVTFGIEASAAQRSAATKVLTENLKAREKADFAAQCETLNVATVTEVVEAKKETTGPGSCPEALKKLAQPLPDTEVARFDTLGGPITALRTKGKKAIALYHGTDHKDYAMPMEQVDGHWKVGALLAFRLG